MESSLRPPLRKRCSLRVGFRGCGGRGPSSGWKPELLKVILPVYAGVSQVV